MSTVASTVASWSHTLKHLVHSVLIIINTFFVFSSLKEMLAIIFINFQYIVEYHIDN